MNTLVNIGATSDGSVNTTAPSAATGANRITLYPRYATSMRNTSAAMMMSRSMGVLSLVVGGAVQSEACGLCGRVEDRHALAFHFPDHFLVMRHRLAKQIAHRDDPDDPVVAVDDRQVANAMAVHEHHAVTDVVGERHGDRRVCHQVGDARVHRRAARR